MIVTAPRIVENPDTFLFDTRTSLLVKSPSDVTKALGTFYSVDRRIRKERFPLCFDGTRQVHFFHLVQPAKAPTIVRCLDLLGFVPVGTAELLALCWGKIQLAHVRALQHQPLISVVKWREEGNVFGIAKYPENEQPKFVDDSEEVFVRYPAVKKGLYH